MVCCKIKLLRTAINVSFVTELLTACGPFAVPGESEDEDGASPTTGTETGADVGAEDSQDSTGCSEDSGLTSDPTPEIGSYNDFVVWLDSLPKPATAACILSRLPRPLRVNGTSSDLSVQPATGPNFPRVFVAVGSIVLGFGVAGPSARAIEFSVLVSATESVKGEIGLPISAELADGDPFERIRSQTGSGTTCVGCHSGERPAGSSFGPQAVTSKALKPMAHQSVGLEALRTLKEEACKRSDDPRCAFLRGVFEHGEIEAYEFPAAMPTMF